MVSIRRPQPSDAGEVREMRVNRIALGGAAVLLVLALAGTAVATPNKGNKGAKVIEK